MILNFAQECYYLENKVGVVDFTKAREIGRFQNLLLPLSFQGNVSFQSKLLNTTTVFCFSDLSGQTFDRKKMTSEFLEQRVVTY